MSFEEKYNRYKKTEKLYVSDDYVNEMAGKISDQISRKKGISRPVVWIFSGATAMAACLIMVFVSPFSSNENTDQSTAQQTDQNHLNTKDSGSLVYNAEIKKFESKELDQDAIVEYLLDEEYEEI